MFLEMFVLFIVTCLVALIVTRSVPLDDRTPNGRLIAIAIISIGGPIAFKLSEYILGSILGFIFGFILAFIPIIGGLVALLLGGVAFWLLVSCTLDKYFNVEYDGSYRLTAWIVITSLVISYVGAGLFYGLAPHFLN